MTEWWRGGVIYQVYPRSFQDSKGDGIGDLPGIIRRLDHIESLGVDCIWLSPITRSPQADMGYDVSDYREVDRLFGSLHDFDSLLVDLEEGTFEPVYEVIEGKKKVVAEIRKAAERASADLLLSFGAATWPHQLVRAMLLEQLYRAATILTGHPYHRRESTSW